ncbi:MAG: enterotoxin (HBL) [Chlorobiales bacterium]|nr:enterotoxin (HBL) [Chlorobiales bacterium]
MLLAHAIRNSAPTLAQAQNTYKENVAAVNTVVLGVLNSKLPVLRHNPPDWQDFVTAYGKAESEALDWVNNVISRLIDVPDEVRSFNPIISMLLQDAKTQATKLVDNPSDKMALQIMNDDFDRLMKQFGLVTAFISGAVKNIQKFQDVLPDMASQLENIAQMSAKDAKADQQQIDNLKSDIKSLQDEIDSLSAAIIALGIADAAAITLGVVATIVAWPVGALAWLFAGPAVAVATAYIAFDAVQIELDQQRIEAEQKLIDELTGDVAVLQLLADNYSKLAEQSKEVEENLQAVLAEWQTLESDVAAAVTDIRTATSDAKSANFNAVLDDINSAITEWNAAYDQAGDLHLDLEVNTAQLALGMSSDEVGEAMKNGKTMGIIQYYNQVAA